ncbi:KIZ protein, partial [Chauna torquata]|nr:KIZ protein [Chauna torquata]
MKLKYMKLKKYLKEIDERQKRALLRNQTFLKEFSQFEAHMKTSSLELIQKMEVWYGREIKSALSLQEGNLSAQSNEEEEYNKQMPRVARQAGIHSGTAMSRGLYHPATIFMGCHTSAVCSMQQKGPQPAESRSVPESCSHRQAAPSSDETDGCLVQASGDTLRVNKPDKRDEKADVLVGEKTPITSSAAVADSSTHSSFINLTECKNPTECCLLSPNRVNVESSTADLEGETAVEEEEEVTREHLVASAEDYEKPIPLASAPEPSISEEDQESISGSGARAGGAHPAEDSSLQPSSPCTVEEEPSGGSAPYGFCSQASSLKEDDDLEAGEAAVPSPAVVFSRPNQSQDADALRASLSSHVLFPAEHHLLLTEEVETMFDNLLVSGKEAPGSQAPPLLREVLPEECGDGSSAQSNESAYSLPSIPNDGGEIKQAKHTPRLDGAGKQ